MRRPAIMAADMGADGIITITEIITIGEALARPGDASSVVMLLPLNLMASAWFGSSPYP